MNRCLRVASWCSECQLRLWTIPQIVTVVGLIHIIAILVMVSQTLFNEVSAPITDQWFLREHNFTGIQDRLVSLDCHLRFIMAERFHAE